MPAQPSTATANPCCFSDVKRDRRSAIVLIISNSFLKDDIHNLICDLREIRHVIKLNLLKIQAIYYTINYHKVNHTKIKQKGEKRQNYDETEETTVNDIILLCLILPPPMIDTPKNLSSIFIVKV